MTSKAKRRQRNLMLMRERERIEKIQTIPEDLIESRQYEHDYLQHERDSVPELLRMGMLDAQKTACLIALESHARCYCNKTGNPLHSLPRETLIALAQKANWARKRALFWLDCIRSNSIDPNWIDTGPESLRYLITADPIGYLIYCLGLIYSPDSIRKSYAGYLPVTGFLESQKQDDYWSKLDVMHDAPVDLQVRILNYHDKIIARSQLHALWNESEHAQHAIIEACEIARRAFGLLSPFDLFKLQSFQNTSIATFTNSLESLNKFKHILLAIIAATVGKITHAQRMRNRDGYISHAEICEIASKLRGLPAFRMQGVDRINKLKSSKDFEVMLALRDFVVSAYDACRTQPRKPVKQTAIIKDKSNPTRICSASALKRKGLILDKRK